MARSSAPTLLLSSTMPAKLGTEETSKARVGNSNNSITSKKSNRAQKQHGGNRLSLSATLSSLPSTSSSSLNNVNGMKKSNLNNNNPPSRSHQQPQASSQSHSATRLLLQTNSSSAGLSKSAKKRHSSALSQSQTPSPSQSFSQSFNKTKNSTSATTIASGKKKATSSLKAVLMTNKWTALASKNKRSPLVLAQMADREAALRKERLEKAERLQREKTLVTTETCVRLYNRTDFVNREFRRHGVNYLPNRTRKKAARRHEKNFRLALGRRRFILSSSSPSYSSHSNRDLSSPLSSSLSSAFLSPYSSTRNVKGKETDDCRNEKVKTRAMEEREENMRENEEKKDKRKEKQSSHFKKRRNKKSATQSPQKVISSTSISSDHQKDDHGERGEEIKRVGSAQSEDTHPLSIKQPHLLFPPHSHSLTLSTSSKSLNLSSDQSLYQPSDLFQAIERSQPDKLYSSLQLALSTKKKRNEKENRTKENTKEGKGEESAERLHRRETNGESNIKKKDSTLEGSLGCRPMSKECPLHVAVLLGELECVSHLLKSGADPNSPNVDGWTPLHYGCHGDALTSCREAVPILEMLLSYGADISRIIQQGNASIAPQSTCVHIVAFSGRTDMMRVLIGHARKLTKKEKRCQEESDNMRKEKNRAERERKSGSEREREIESEKETKEDGGRELREKEKKIPDIQEDEREKNQKPIKGSCVREEGMERTDKKDNGRKEGNREVIEGEEDEGERRKHRKNEKKRQKERKRRQREKFSQLNLLLNGLDVQKNTPLHIAARCGHSDMVDLLLRKGADPRLQNSQFMTPYDLSENDECARILSRFEKKLPPKRLAVLMQSAAVIKSKAKKIREKRKEKERARKNEDKRNGDTAGSRRVGKGTERRTRKRSLFRKSFKKKSMMEEVFQSFS